MVAVSVRVCEFHGRAVAILARQDLKGESRPWGRSRKTAVRQLRRRNWLGKPVNQKTGRLLLYMLGLVLTFNLGRDITLITLYPFLFGYIMLTMWAQFKGER